MKKIALRSWRGTIRAYALVDDEDYPWLSQWRWHLHSKGYAIRSTSSQGKFFMHREVVIARCHPLLPVEVVHHKDGNPLNNQIANLEIIATSGDHLRMHFAGKGRGVCFERRTGRWVSYLDRPGERREYIGRHDTEQEALDAVAERKSQWT